MNQLVSGYTILIVPTLVMFAISLIEITAYGGMSGEIFVSAIAAMVEAILYSLVFYGLSSLVGVVPGLTVVQLLLTAVAIFIIPLTYSLTVWFSEIFIENFWTEFYLTADIAAFLTPVIRFFVNEDRLRFYEAIIYILVAALFFFLTHILYRKYRPERAGIPVIFPALGEVIKYILVFPMTLAGGLLFYLMMNKAAWTIFGMICGGLLTFMLVNTILNKSAKALFRGVIGLGVYAGAMVVVMILTFSNMFGINTKLPASSSKIGVVFDDNTKVIYFRDKEVKAAIKRLYDERNEWMSFEPDTLNTSIDGGYYDSYVWRSQVYSRLDLKIVCYPTVGIPVAKEFCLYNKNELADSLRTILDSKEFRKQYAEVLDDVDFTKNRSNIGLSTGYRFVMGDGFIRESDFSIYSLFSRDTLADSKLKELETAVRNDIKNVNFDYFQQTTFGTLNTYGRNNGIARYIYPIRIFLPLNLSTSETLEVLHRLKLSNVSPENYVSEIAKHMDTMSVTNMTTGETVEYTKESERIAILSSISAICSEYSDSDICQLTLFDNNYSISYSIIVGQDELDGSYGSICFSGVFLYGKVPEFVK